MTDFQEGNQPTIQHSQLKFHKSQRSTLMSSNKKHDSAGLLNAFFYCKLYFVLNINTTRLLFSKLNYIKMH